MKKHLLVMAMVVYAPAALAQSQAPYDSQWQQRQIDMARERSYEQMIEAQRATEARNTAIQQRMAAERQNQRIGAGNE